MSMADDVKAVRSFLGEVNASPGHKPAAEALERILERYTLYLKAAERVTELANRHAVTDGTRGGGARLTAKAVRKALGQARLGGILL